jgi:hypothetical protein
MKKTIKAAKFESNKMHIYDVKTKGKNIVHMIEGGEYLTLDDTIFNYRSDVGWFYLNQKEYDYFLSKLEDITLEIIRN